MTTASTAAARRQSSRQQSSRQQSALTRAAIVAAAITLADRDGLDAVSIRGVAAALSARPMSLYNFVATKDDLIGAMVDAVMGEIVLDVLPKNWRKALLAISVRTLEVGSRHRWLIAASFRASQSGEHEEEHSDQSLAAIAVLNAPDADARALLLSIDVFTVGFATSLWSANQFARFDDHLAVFTKGFDWLLDGFERSLEK
jgi:AcrR family transcriptional regulator